jgi:threonine 3-dehydrogenase
MTKQERILLTGALGQIGTELVDELRKKYGKENVVASDIRLPNDLKLLENGPFEFVDATQKKSIQNVVVRRKITCIIHNAAFLSAVAEKYLDDALILNTIGTHNILSVAQEFKCKAFIPSSIAAFGPSTPLQNTPNDTIQRPTSIYGIGKVYVEMLGEYYTNKFGLDFRSLRYPGIVSWKAPPGGGTTDYSVEMFYYALKGEKYSCFLSEDVRLPFMYMPDCINSTIKLIETDTSKLKHRVFNVTSFNITPKELEQAIKKYLPNFQCEYKPDPLRQGFAESWPKSLDDSCAREEWGWKEEYDLDAMVRDMLVNLARELKVNFQLK